MAGALAEVGSFLVDRFLAPLLVVSAASAGLLTAAGTFKILEPQGLVEALATAGLPHSIALVRALCVVEIAAGLAAIFVGGFVTLNACACLYLAFFVFVTSSKIRHLPLRTCGCFGRPDSPVSRLHVALTGGLAGVLFAAGAKGLPGVATLFGQIPAATYATLLFLSLAAGLFLYAALDPLAVVFSRMVFRPRRS